MQNNYFFLRQVAAVLATELHQMMLVSCFSQSRDELVMEFRDGQRKLFVRATLLHTFACLSFPAEFGRARKNSVDIFNAALMKRVEGVVMTPNDRSFRIQLAGQSSILFKMHGNQSNVLYLENDTVQALFKNGLEQDREIHPDALARTIDWSEEYFLQQRDRVRKCYPTLGAPVWQYLTDHGFDQLNAAGEWQLLQQTLALLQEPKYYMNRESGGLAFSLLPGREVVESWSDPLLAVTTFYHSYQSTSALERDRKAALTDLGNRIRQLGKFIDETLRKRQQASDTLPYAQWADTLMGGIYGMGLDPADPAAVAQWETTLRGIPLDSALSHHQNAERFYQLARKAKTEQEKTDMLLNDRRNELAELQSAYTMVETTSQLDVVRRWLSAEADAEEEESLPYHSVEYKGFRILVGKNARSNDELTQRHSGKDDLWLHVRDVPGSHVVIRYQSGKTFPRDVVERAAQIAAWYSKRKNETLCPVMVTPRKFVRKRKDSPPGMVVVEKEETIMVEPKDFK